MRVLIAEDEALIRMDLREMLEEEGHEVVGEARDGAEALTLARATRPDIVFMDVKMPNVDGIEAAAAIAAESIAPVVMVTAFSQAGLVEEAARAGAMGYVVKPFSRNDIVPAMQVAVSRFAETQAARAARSATSRSASRRARLVDRAKGLLMAQRASASPRRSGACRSWRWTSASRCARSPRRSSRRTRRWSSGALGQDASPPESLLRTEGMWYPAGGTTACRFRREQWRSPVLTTGGLFCCPGSTVWSPAQPGS